MRVLYNAHIYTQDETQPVVSALAIERGRILAAGTDEDILAFAPPGAALENLNGKTIWPGLTDAHLHMQYYSEGLSVVDCETPTKEECLRRVAERAARLKPGEWIRGHGWNQNVWQGGFGTAADLDQAAPNNPVFLTAKSLHAAWANSAALKLAGFDENTPDPADGKIMRDSSGKPNGILLESAYSVLETILPKPTAEELSRLIHHAQKVLWSQGITGVHDFDRSLSFAALQILNQHDQLRLRVLKSIPIEDLPHAIAIGLRSGFGNDFLRIGSVKLFADGALGPQSAAMLQPYEGEPEKTGMLFMDAEQIFEYGQQASANGFSMAIHAIGDRANHEVISAYQQLRGFETRQSLPHPRHRIEHVQLLHPDDLPLIAANHIIASMQPIHATSDMFMADRYWGKRSALGYALGSIVNLGTAYAFGSDSPVESPNPFLGIHAAVTRCRPDGQPGHDGWYPQQRISLQKALYGYTLGPAYAAGWEDRLGKLAAGYYADLIVLDQDPFELSTQDIHAIQPEAVMVNGSWTWHKGS